MNYDSIIVELLSRIQVLEENVEALQNEIYNDSSNRKITTEDIRSFILNEISKAAESGQPGIILRASNIHKTLDLKSRYPMVCNAMKQCMKENDKILHETASGYSSSLEIEYFCGN